MPGNPTVGGDTDTWGDELNAKLDRWVNAADFGVAADGTTKDGDALQSAINYCVAHGCELRLPGGTLLMRDASGAAKQLTVDLEATRQPNVPTGSFRMIGPGVDTCTLKWSDDIGAGECGLDVINAGQTNFPHFEGFSLSGKYEGRKDPNANATPTSAGCGMRLSNRSFHRSISSSGFWAGFLIDGEDTGSGSTENTDHTDVYWLNAASCVYGVYVTGDGRKSRDFNFVRCYFSTNQRAGIGIAENAELTDCTFIDCHWNASPFGFWKEGATPSNTAYLGNVHFIRHKFEGPGNGFFWCEATDGSGDFQRLVGYMEWHGIETNGQSTGTGGGVNDHGTGDTNHTWRPWSASSISRNGSGTVTATFAALPTPLQVGDVVVVYVSDNHTLNSSGAGGFTVESISGTGPYTVTWEQTGSSTSAVGTVGPCVAMRGGALVESNLILSILDDPTTTNAHPEVNFDLSSADEVILETQGGEIPKFRLSGSGGTGRKTNVLWRRGQSEAYLARATGTFAAGKQLESDTNGGVKLSTLTLATPNAGTALQPGATAISVATGQVVSLRWVFVMMRGRNAQFSFGGAGGDFGPGATYTTDPGNPAVLCEDPSHHGDVMACPFTSGNTYRVVGYSLAAGAGGLIDYMQREPCVVAIP